MGARDQNLGIMPLPSTAKRTPAMSMRQFQSKLLQVMYERRTAKCPYCRYSLDGIPGPRCPECGHNVAEYLRRPRSGVRGDRAATRGRGGGD